MRDQSTLGQVAMLSGILACLIAGAILPEEARSLAWGLPLAAIWPVLLYRFLRRSNASRGKAEPVSEISDTCASSLANVYRATAEALASAIAAKDSYTHHHVTRVQYTCELVSAKLGLDTHDIEGIKIAALVRDVGKLGVPDHILLKPGPLDPDEFTKMRNHATTTRDTTAAVTPTISKVTAYRWGLA